MKRTIELAVEGGYVFRDMKIIEDNGRFFRSDGDGGYLQIQSEQILLDILFWQCLGKSLGWDNWQGEGGGGGSPDWLFNWHRFVDWIAQGKDVDSFFSQIIPDKQK